MTGPSAPRSDVTDAAGQVTFSKLTPNPGATCPPDCYDLTATLSGYVQLDAPTRINVGPGQTATPTIQIYRPSTINLVVNDPGGQPYPGTASVKLTSARNGGTETVSVTGGSAAVFAVNGESIVPSVQYNAEAWTTGASPLCATALTQYVPDGYPNDLTSTFVLTLANCPSGNLRVTVTRSGSPDGSATVTLSGGPYALSPVSGTTNPLGTVMFSNVPSGTGYTVKAYNTACAVGNPKSGQLTGQTVNTGGTTDVAVNYSLNTCPLP
ncbi:MAG: hypothetical protein H0U46_05000 [Actinobacteria bacterium]|nr:hypothetical protein [Actinomycetota bacterium]